MEEHNQNTLWSAIENVLGRQKAAALKYTPLDEFVRTKVAVDEDIDVQDDTIMADLMSIVGKKAARKRSKWDTIKRASDHLPEDVKNGSKSIFKKLATCEKYRIAEDYATGRDKEALRQKRRRADRDALNTLKKEAAGSILQGIKSSVKNIPGGETMAKGLGFGAGASVPAYAAGSALIGDAEESGENLMDDARNKALQTGLGLGGMYLAGKGVSGMMGGDEEEEENQIQTKQSSRQKLSSDKLNEKLRDFSSTVLIDELISKTSSNDGYEKVARLNTDYAIDTALDLLIRR